MPAVQSYQLHVDCRQCNMQLAGCCVVHWQSYHPLLMTAIMITHNIFIDDTRQIYSLISYNFPLYEWQRTDVAHDRYFHRSALRRVNMPMHGRSIQSIILSLNSSIGNLSQDGQLSTAICYWPATKTFRSASWTITSAFYSLPVYAGSEATLGQSRSVGTLPFRVSAHTQWKSTVGGDESVGNWHRAPGIRQQALFSARLSPPLSA